MKVITIKQPWATLIIEGIKDIENRDWKTKYRGEIFIHAGLSEDEEAMKKYKDYLKGRKLVKGAIIGSVDIVNCVNSSPSAWFKGKYGFVLKNAKIINQIYTKGKLGIWSF